ncbi:MAG: magnesium transporter CorA family protein [Ottowia sp.]|uniref:magnesium transporter CorA family protein n=1 Tax=Ottowia sp. TaxID=1898956 RepID=UPI0011D45393|nr:magnesium transporter CorA family protein [Ottowia sp.]MBP7459588.1 magnesium transporter CorA family protein [Ottowia sp.]MBP9524627.1 magnesium transporter CorA family protein [Ottowia sp.]TXI26367.1 MAG: magnesium transporter CorA [Ottowia sp.]HPU12095.1 magnesium transporter CorA family protein [Ottowia sp.]HRL31367.1 magnesium transporter CorA family protein [Ottowia sp.]
MHIVEFTAGSLRFVDAAPERAPDDGFVWIYLDRTDFVRHLADVQAAAQRLGGSALLDVHVKDLASDSHPSHYDATSVYDMVIFRRLATLAEVQRDQEQVNAIASYHAHGVGASALTKPLVPEAFSRIDSRAVGFAIFDKLLISVHPAGCYTANSYVQRFVADAKLAVDTAGTRNRVPQGPSDLVLRTINTMVDSYLDLRKDLATALENAQAELLKPDPRQDTWSAMMHARRRLHALQDLCEEQQDAMQEWLDTLRELPLTAYHADPAQAQARRDQLVARARDVMEHIDRVLHHARRLEQSAETAVQIHFSAQGHRTNDIMRTLTAVTAIFLPLNLFTGFFGMNFEHLPLIHSTEGMWVALALLALLAGGILAIFWRRRYLTRTGR